MVAIKGSKKTPAQSTRLTGYGAVATATLNNEVKGYQDKIEETRPADAHSDAKKNVAELMMKLADSKAGEENLQVTENNNEIKGDTRNEVIATSATTNDESVAKLKNNVEKTDAIAVLNENGGVDFLAQFQVKHKQREDFGKIAFAAPRDISMEVNIKAKRDNFTMFELHNLLYAYYAENGLPPALLKRYRKAFKK